MSRGWNASTHFIEKNYTGRRTDSDVIITCITRTQNVYVDGQMKDRKRIVVSCGKIR